MSNFALRSPLLHSDTPTFFRPLANVVHEVIVLNDPCVIEKKQRSGSNYLARKIGINIPLESQLILDADISNQRANLMPLKVA